MSPEDTPAPREASLADRAVFAAQFVRAPVATASVWPSSTALARGMADAALRTAPADPVVVELGAGSGAFTGLLTQRLAGRGRQLAVEINPVLAHRLAERFGGVEVVPADVAELGALLALRDIRGAHAVVSGLGWSATRPGREDSLLPVVARALTDDGVFVQFAYCATAWAAPARALREELGDCFADVETSPVVWRNLPPAIVYRASRPRR
ncbi:class I SAM-dependent methyltransferase [Actinomycetospora straminea]|uniref:Methyltransferase domain-containing protein n=1 Tax=Actinomycetospora straminea TaxID=663607 RepID=A0ABP9E9U0_9PSEU|nr:SAM-dependent methyltransferase [Actinomycetospora straminea]MDD7936030.1 SAM-dependent methyltransferase [Actinomycetospora straminea]